MQNDPIQGQGQGHRGPKVAKMADFKVYLLPGVHVIKRLMNNYDIGQYLFFRTEFWSSSLFVVTWPSKLGCYENTRSRPAVPYGAYLFFFVTDSDVEIIRPKQQAIGRCHSARWLRYVSANQRAASSSSSWWLPTEEGGAGLRVDQSAVAVLSHHCYRCNFELG